MTGFSGAGGRTAQIFGQWYAHVRSEATRVPTSSEPEAVGSIINDDPVVAGKVVVQAADHVLHEQRNCACAFAGLFKLSEKIGVDVHQWRLLCRRRSEITRGQWSNWVSLVRTPNSK